MKIAVHVHLFYIEMLDEMTSYIRNLPPCGVDIFFTLSESQPIVEQKIKKDYLEYNTQISIIDNIGFDVYPFLCFLNIIDLNYYDLIVKVHSKKNVLIPCIFNGYNLSGSSFRKYLFTAILGTKKRVEDIINMFSSQNDIGMIGAQELIIRDKAIDRHIDMSQVEAVLKECKQNIAQREFIGGTMFIARAFLFQSIKDRNYQAQRFSSLPPSRLNGLPYCLERCFGFIVSSQGYKLVGIKSTHSSMSATIKNIVTVNIMRIKIFITHCIFLLGKLRRKILKAHKVDKC